MARDPITSGQITPREIAEELRAQCPDIIKVPERDREVIALHAIYLPAPRIAKMLGLTCEQVVATVASYGDYVKGAGDSLRMKILRMAIWRFAATQVSVLMEATAGATKEAVANLEKIPKIMEKLAGVEKTLISTERQHKEMNFDDFGQSLSQ